MLDNVGVLNPNMWMAYGWDRWEYSYNDLYEGNTRKGYVYYNPDTDETFFQLNYCNGKWVTVKKPSTANLNHNPAMREYIFKKVMELDSALRNRNHDPDKISQLLDLESFASWMMVEEIMDNTDASFHSSVYMYVDAGGKFTFGPAWDFDRSSGNCSYWHNDIGSLIGGTDWGRYAFGTQAGAQALLKVYNRFKQNTANWEKKMDEYADMLEKSAASNFQRWQILGKHVYYNSDQTATIPTFRGQVDFLKNFLRNRFSKMTEYANNYQI
jgi:spore coat protein CotH